MNRTIQILTILLVTVAACAVCLGQSNGVPVHPTDVSDRIYEVSEIDVRARVKNAGESIPEFKSDCPEPVQVSLEFVIRKTGEVTDIKLLKMAGCSFDNEAIKAVRKLKFDPAMKNGRPVSQISEIAFQERRAELLSRGSAIATPLPPPSDPVLLNYGLMLDLSGSLREDSKDVIGAARLIIEANRPTDETFIVGFAGPEHIATVQDFTFDKARLLDSTNGLKVVEGQSAINDAVYLGLQHLIQENPRPRARRALVLITDGEDRASYYKTEQVTKYLRQYQVPVYVLACMGKMKNAQNARYYAAAMKYLNRLADESGGKVIVAGQGKDIEAKAGDIIQLLHP